MAQFDVYNNPSKKTAEAYPYLVDVQNPIIEQIDTRLVVPLTAVGSKQAMMMKKLTPEVKIEGEKYLLLTPQLASIPEKLLRYPIGTLSNSRTLIINALDFAITGI